MVGRPSTRPRWPAYASNPLDAFGNHYSPSDEAADLALSTPARLIRQGLIPAS